MKKYLNGIIILIFLSACGNHSSENVMADQVISSEQTIEASYLEESDESVAKSTEIEEEVIITDAIIDRKLIKEAEIKFETDSISVTKKRIKSLLSSCDAYISYQNQLDDYYESTQYLTIKVPSKDFDLLMDRLSVGVKEFDTKTVVVKDVDKEYHDLKARIKAKTEVEKRYFELLKSAQNIDEMLSVEYQLAEVRTSLEALEGRLNFLKNRTSLSTINLSFYEKKHYEPKKEKNRFLRNFIRGWDGLISFILGLVNVWPFVLIMIGAGVIINKRLKNRRKQKNK